MRRERELAEQRSNYEAQLARHKADFEYSMRTLDREWEQRMVCIRGVVGADTPQGVEWDDCPGAMASYWL